MSSLIHFFCNDVVSVLDEQGFVLWNFVIILKHNWIITLHVCIHGRVIVASVLGTIHSSMLLSQFLELLLYFLLSLQCLFLCFLFLLSKFLLLFKFLLLLLFLFLFFLLFLLLSLFFEVDTASLHLLSHQLKSLCINEWGKCRCLLTILQIIKFILS